MVDYGDQSTPADDNSLPEVPERRNWMHGDDSERKFNQMLKAMPNSRRLAYWTVRVAEEAGRWAEAEYKGGLVDGYVAVGYVDPELDEVSDKELGVIAYQFTDDVHPGHLIDLLEVDAIKVPIVRRAVRYEAHVSLRTSLREGVAGCWAVGDQGDVDEGWLTAKHVVEDEGGQVIFGQQIDLFERGSFVGSGLVIRAARRAIDVALVHAHAGRHAPWEPLSTTLGCFNLPVEFVKLSGKLAPAKIINVPTESPHLMASAEWPQRFTMDPAGDDGDSGSLIRHTKSGAAVGIYVGQDILSTTSGSYKYFGVGVPIEQVQAVMRVRLFG
ncbi:hypothetical protein OHA45_13335 [Streptomyces lydicus]|uniref:hypothetical protein n=1 Tax=Streptomyces lydicus TaxID=47763 RepID=UPI002E30481A|nr:hypothetical protein [Streptomyces lydicus]